MTSPTFIDQIPTQNDLKKRGFGASVNTDKVYERVPYAYARNLEHADFGADSLRSLLTSLNNELQWGNPETRHELIENAYLVARGIGDSVVAAASTSALNLIDSTRVSARYNTKYRDTTVEKAMGHVRTFSDGSAEYGIDIDKLGLDKIKARLREQGYEPQPMVAVLALVHTAAHEAGHMIQRGVGYMGIGSDKGVSGINALSDAVLSNCPEARLTQNHETNVAIHNERFAEGYANLTLRAAAESLGYSKDYAEALVRAIAIDGVSPAMHEHIAAASEGESVKSLYEKAGQTPEYSGMLGYTKPLTLDQIVADLEFVGDELRRYDGISGYTEPIQSNDTLIDISNAYKQLPAELIERPSEEITFHRKGKMGGRVIRAIGHFIRGERKPRKQ